MENYCIGRLFFDELPSGCLEVLERHSLPEVYFVEGTTNEGEIQVGSLLAILQHIKEIQTSSKEKPTDTWYELEVKNLIEQLEQAVIVDLVDSESYVQFTCF